MKKTFGVGRDWPIDYDDSEDYYVEAEHELGVSGNHEELGLFDAHRSRPFPMPGQALTYSDQLIKARIDGKKVGDTTITVTTTPQARNSEPYDGRPACEGHSNCIPLCPIHAKYDATVHLRRLSAEEEHRAAQRLRRDSAGKGRAGSRHAGALQEMERARDAGGSSALRSWWLRHTPSKPPNFSSCRSSRTASDQVGRNLMDHIQWEVTALFDEPIYPFRGPQSVTAIESFREWALPLQRSGFRMTIGNDGWGRAGSPAKIIDGLLAKKIYGPELSPTRAMKSRSMIRLSFSTEMLPRADNRVQVSDQLDDALKLPRPLITFGSTSTRRAG